MIYTSTISCGCKRDIALCAVDEIMCETGFVATGNDDDEIRRFRNPTPWYCVRLSNLYLAERVSFRADERIITIEADFRCVITRTMMLIVAMTFLIVALIVDNAAGAQLAHPVGRTLVPIAFSFLLIPLLHHFMNRAACKRWDQALRLIGRTAAAREAEIMRQSKAAEDVDQSISAF